MLPRNFCHPATGQSGQEMDREKYKMLISEYRKFKTKNLKHFRLNSAAIMSSFGEYSFGHNAVL